MRTAFRILTAIAGVVCAADAPPSTTLRGKLVVREGKPRVLETADHKAVKLAGDKSTSEVLGEARMDGFEVEARGHFTAPDQFPIDPIHTRAMMAHKDGHLKPITYWCDVCSLRTWAVRLLPEGNHARFDGSGQTGQVACRPAA